MMKRRILLAGMAAAFTLGLAVAQTSEYPSQPITFISPTVPGGAMDGVARVLAERLGQKLGQPVVVDAKPGGGGAVGMSRAARAPANGHHLVIAVDSMLTVVPRLVKNAGYLPEKDFVPVIEVGTSPMVLLAHPSLGVKNLTEYIALARSRPGAVRYGSGGNGSPHHLNMALLERGAGINLSHVPYKGGAQAFTDLLGGHIPSMFIALSTAQAQIKSNSLVPLGVTSTKRLAEAPDIPTIAEQVPGYDNDFWFAIFAPAGTPQPIVARLNRELATILAEPEVEKKMRTLGMSPTPGTPQALAERLRKDMTKMDRLIRDVDLKAE